MNNFITRRRFINNLGDIGCHCLDAPFWALDLGMPTAVDVILDEPANQQYTPFGAHVIYHFPARDEKPPVTLHWYEGRPRPPKLEGMKELPGDGMYMLGSLAIRAGHRIEWDAEAMQVTNAPELNKWIKEPVRKGWNYGDHLWT